MTLTCRSPTINTLIGIPDNGDTARVLCEKSKKLVLGRVGVLELVNEDMATARKNAGVRSEKFQSIQQEIIKVEARQ